MQVLDSSGAEDGVGTVLFNTAPTEIDFTPTSTTVGTTTVVISEYEFETLGKFTITYAKDVTGTLTRSERLLECEARCWIAWRGAL